MFFTVVFWQRNVGIGVCEFDASEDNWRDALEQNCPGWAALAKIECEEWYGVFEIEDPRDYSSWTEIPELEQDVSPPIGGLLF